MKILIEKLLNVSLAINGNKFVQVKYIVINWKWKTIKMEKHITKLLKLPWFILKC